MNIRYRNIRDSAVSKHSMFWFLLKYGTIFVRSSAAEWDFQAHYVPKVWKVYALVNALARYTDEERSRISTIEELHMHHQWKEFSVSNLQSNLDILRSLPWIRSVIVLEKDVKEFIVQHEFISNHGVHESLRRKYTLCLLHDSLFRSAPTPLVHTTAHWEVFFPWVPFPEVRGESVISGSPSTDIHAYLAQYFPYIWSDDATILVGWDENTSF
jgi:hypothetical protein